MRSGEVGRGMPPVARFITASGMTNLGDGVAVLAWSWTASLLTRDPLLIALTAVALRMPWVLFSLPAGIVADRMDRRVLIVRMDVLRALAFAAVAAALWSAMPLAPPPRDGVSAPWAYAALLVAAAVVGMAEVFRDNAAQTMLPSLVPDARLESANGRLWSVEMIGNSLAGPPLGALLVAASLPLPFAFNVGAYALAAVIVGGMAPAAPPARKANDWRAELAEGIAFLRGSPLLMLLAWVTGLWNLLFQMLSIALVLHVQDNLRLPSSVYGLVLGAGAVGGIAGALAGERVVRAIGPARAAQWSLLATAPACAAVALSPDAWRLGLTLAFFEAAGMVWNTVAVTGRQRIVPNGLLGRVNSAYRLLALGMMPVGLLLSGLVVRALEVVVARETALTAPFWIAAAGVALLTVASWRRLGDALSRPLLPATQTQAEPAP